MKYAVGCLAFGLGLLVQVGLRPDSHRQEDTLVAKQNPVGRQHSGTGFSATLETSRAFRGLDNAARLLERIDSASAAAFPRLDALFSLEGGESREILREAWLEKDPRGMLAHHLRIAHLEGLHHLALGVFDALSVADPDVALRLLDELALRKDRDALRWQLLSNLAAHDSARAARWLAENGDVLIRSDSPDQDGPYRTPFHFGGIVDAINALPDSVSKARLLRQIFGGRRLDADNAEAWSRIKDDQLAAELFTADRQIPGEGNPELGAKISRRVAGLLETNPTEPLFAWASDWSSKTGDLEGMRRIFDLALGDRALKALGLADRHYVLGGFFEFLEGERLTFAIENLERLPLGDAYESAAFNMVTEFTKRGELANGVAWMGTQAGGVRESAFERFGSQLYGPMDADAAIRFMQLTFDPADIPAAAEGLGRRIAEADRPEGMLYCAGLLDSASRARFLEGIGSGVAEKPGVTLEAITKWPEVDRNAVFQGMLRQVEGNIFPPEPATLTVPQLQAARDLAASLISDPERRARFLRGIGMSD